MNESVFESSVHGKAKVERNRVCVRGLFFLCVTYDDDSCLRKVYGHW